MIGLGFVCRGDVLVERTTRKQKDSLCLKTRDDVNLFTSFRSKLTFCTRSLCFDVLYEFSPRRKVSFSPHKTHRALNHHLYTPNLSLVNILNETRYKYTVLLYMPPTMKSIEHLGGCASVTEKSF